MPSWQTYPTAEDVVNHSASYTRSSFFPSSSQFFLSPYPSKPSSISISSTAKAKWWEERWNKVVSHIWHHQGKTCQSFCAEACLWLWERAATISREPRPLSHQGKALERTGCKGAKLIGFDIWTPYQLTGLYCIPMDTGN